MGEVRLIYCTDECTKNKLLLCGSRLISELKDNNTGKRLWLISLEPSDYDLSAKTFAKSCFEAKDCTPRMLF